MPKTINEIWTVFKLINKLPNHYNFNTYLMHHKAVQFVDKFENKISLIIFGNIFQKISGHLFLAFEFDSNCQALGGLAVRVEFKCFVSAPCGSFRRRFRSLSEKFSIDFRMFRFVFFLFFFVFCRFFVFVLANPRIISEPALVKARGKVSPEQTTPTCR